MTSTWVSHRESTARYGCLKKKNCNTTVQCLNIVIFWTLKNVFWKKNLCSRFLHCYRNNTRRNRLIVFHLSSLRFSPTSVLHTQSRVTRYNNNGTYRFLSRTTFVFNRDYLVTLPIANTESSLPLALWRNKITTKVFTSVFPNRFDITYNLENF